MCYQHCLKVFPSESCDFDLLLDKLWPVGRMQPVPLFNPALKPILEENGRGYSDVTLVAQSQSFK